MSNVQVNSRPTGASGFQYPKARLDGDASPYL